MEGNGEKIAESVLRYIPWSWTIPITRLEKITWEQLGITREDLDQVISKLMEEGLIYEPKPGEYQRVSTQQKDQKEGKKPQSSRKYLDLQAKLRLTENGNVELKVYLPPKLLEKVMKK